MFYNFTFFISGFNAEILRDDKNKYINLITRQFIL